MSLSHRGPSAMEPSGQLSSSSILTGEGRCLLRLLLAPCL